MQKFSINIISSQIPQDRVIIEPWAEEYSLSKYPQILLKVTLESVYNIDI